MRKILLVAGGALSLTACSYVVGPETYLSDRNIGVPTPNRLTVCAGDTCAMQRDIALTDADRQRLRAFFAGDVGDGAGERERLKRAIDWLEHRTGVHTKRPPLEGLNGRRVKEVFWNYNSCIDDTTNTTAFLLILQQMGLLRRHEVDGPAYRGLVFDGKVPHFTAVIREKGTGVKYAVDTWLYTTGEPVIVKPLADWLWQS